MSESWLKFRLVIRGNDNNIFVTLPALPAMGNTIRHGVDLYVVRSVCLESGYTEIILGVDKV